MNKKSQMMITVQGVFVEKRLSKFGELGIGNEGKETGSNL